MADATGIAWTHSTFNGWVGCTRVSPGCDHCYAEVLAKRTGLVGWGPHAPRRLTSPANWRKPIRWNREAAAAGARRRVFCSSMADVFDNAVPAEWRDGLWETVRRTSWLDWQLLTKRPQNMPRMLPPDWRDGYPNVWLGTTCENQEEADRRIPVLLGIPARVRFLSCEPLIGPVSFRWAKWVDHREMLAAKGSVGHLDGLAGIHWVIVGGESGAGARPMDPAWARALRDQCAEAGVPFFFKQTGSRREAWPGVTGKGDDPAEWPSDLRVQAFPDGADA